MRHDLNIFLSLFVVSLHAEWKDLPQYILFTCSVVVMYSKSFSINKVIKQRSAFKCSWKRSKLIWIGNKWKEDTKSLMPEKGFAKIQKKEVAMESWNFMPFHFMNRLNFIPDAGYFNLTKSLLFLFNYPKIQTFQYVQHHNILFSINKFNCFAHFCL